MSALQLAETLTNGAEADQAAAAQMLAAMGPEAAPAAAALVRGCSNPAASEWCVAALEELGPPPTHQITELSELLNSTNVESAYWAATLLGRCGADAAGVVPTLASVAASEADLAIRERTVWALSKIGPTALAVLPTLEKLANLEHTRLARLAQQAIKQIKS